MLDSPSAEPERGDGYTRGAAYEDDFYAWTRHQASALRRLADQRWTGPLDLLHLAEEVEGLGSEQQWAVESQLERIIEHLLKLEHSPSSQPQASVDDRSRWNRRGAARLSGG